MRLGGRGGEGRDREGGREHRNAFPAALAEVVRWDQRRRLNVGYVLVATTAPANTADSMVWLLLLLNLSIHPTPQSKQLVPKLLLLLLLHGGVAFAAVVRSGLLLAAARLVSGP